MSSSSPFLSAAPPWLRQPVVGAALLAAVFVVAGCSPKAPRPAMTHTPLATGVPAAAAETPALPEPQMPAPVELNEKASAPEDPVARLLAQTDRALRMSAVDLSREIVRLSETEEASVEAPLLLAVALAQTRQPVDTARALGLVQRVLGNGAPAALALHPLARLMESRLLQQRRLEDQLERQNQQLRDALRRNDQLNERLEAMRAIERSLTTRPTPPASGNGASAPRSTP